jgi:hypothetical protein
MQANPRGACQSGKPLLQLIDRIARVLGLAVAPGVTMGRAPTGRRRIQRGRQLRAATPRARLVGPRPLRAAGRR